MKRTLKYKANWLSRMTFILFGLFFLHSNLGAFLSQIEIGNNVGVFEYSLELEDDFSGQVVECSFPDSYSSFSRVSEPKNAHIKGVEVAAKGVTNALKLRPDIVLSGGRSGQLVKNLTGPANSVLKGGGNRIFITDDAGKVIWDVTANRAKSVIPGKGFGPKVTPTQEQLNLLNKIWGN